MTITDKVIEDLKGRNELGIKRYGKPLHIFNDRSALQDAYEEVLDLSQYLKQELEERKHIKEVVFKEIEKMETVSAYGMKEGQQESIPMKDFYTSVNLLMKELKRRIDEVI